MLRVTRSEEWYKSERRAERDGHLNVHVGELHETRGKELPKGSVGIKLELRVARISKGLREEAIGI